LNSWHACILEHHDITSSLKLIACLMRFKKNRLDKCADRLKIDVTDVKNCKNTRQVNDILKKYGEETAKISFLGVPAIALDNVSSCCKTFGTVSQDSLFSRFMMLTYQQI